MSQTKGNSHPDPDITDPRPLVFAVDDEPMLLELLALVLDPLGFRVRTFRDPATAIRAFGLQDPPPALIVTDYAMHNLTGMDLIRECRRINPKQKIIMVSGTVDESIYRHSAQKPDRFLPKPYQGKQLAELVREVLRMK
jgi:two-component system cell cycle sensor histidine kinase/response regulator CckA